MYKSDLASHGESRWPERKELRQAAKSEVNNKWHLGHLLPDGGRVERENPLSKIKAKPITLSHHYQNVRVTQPQKVHYHAEARPRGILQTCPLRYIRNTEQPVWQNTRASEGGHPERSRASSYRDNTTKGRFRNTHVSLREKHTTDTSIMRLIPTTDEEGRAMGPAYCFLK